MTRARDIANFGDGIATADIGDGQITTAKIASGAITDALLPAGSVLQVVESNMSGDGIFSTASTSYVDVGLSATITPTSASSKILVSLNTGGVGRPPIANEALRMQILRGRSQTQSLRSSG